MIKVTNRWNLHKYGTIEIISSSHDLVVISIRIVIDYDVTKTLELKQ